MIDIDNFKNINDKYGHDEGDVVLKEIAVLLDKNKRENDLVIRYGGEEFLWVAPETDKKDAGFITTRMLEKIRENVFKINSAYLKITISIGVSTFLPKKHAIEFISEVVSKADEALYQAKYRGKDTCIYLEYS
jgi:diguanylate cyclase (GGDEF)-like protein